MYCKKYAHFVLDWFNFWLQRNDVDSDIIFLKPIKTQTLYSPKEFKEICFLGQQ